MERIGRWARLLRKLRSLLMDGLLANSKFLCSVISQWFRGFSTTSETKRTYSERSESMVLVDL